MTPTFSTTRPRGGAVSSTGLSTARAFVASYGRAPDLGGHQPFLIRWVSSVTWS
jgi:hypothetical protein